MSLNKIYYVIETELFLLGGSPSEIKFNKPEKFFITADRAYFENFKAVLRRSAS